MDVMAGRVGKRDEGGGMFMNINVLGGSFGGSGF